MPALLYLLMKYAYAPSPKMKARPTPPSARAEYLVRGGGGSQLTERHPRGSHQGTGGRYGW